jgi:tetraacyldisaccharide 4'-kinase
VTVGERLARAWSRRGPLAIGLLPLAGVFSALAALRRRLYALRWLRSERLAVPVIVVGNITVGGSGKTPVVIALAQALALAGRRPGVVSRGYGGSAAGPRAVDPADPAALVGDEPLLIARRAGVPVWIGARRAEAGRALLAARPECDLLICDDGLQHYALRRDVELAVIDPRGFGNGWPLPAGPLREPPVRLAAVDALILNGTAPPPPALPAIPRFPMRLVGERFYRLAAPGLTCGAADLAGRRLHAAAGIGDPSRFFAHLRALGLVFEAHPFADHHRFVEADFGFVGGATLLLTEKDAVKCAAFAPADTWVLPVRAELPPELVRLVLEKIHGSASARDPRLPGDQGAARV